MRLYSTLLQAGTQPSKFDDKKGQDWGYLNNKGWLGPSQPTFGILTEIHNKTDIKNILMFYWGEKESSNTYKGLYLRVSSNEGNYQTVVELLKKSLDITVDNATHNFGTTPPKKEGNTDYIYTVQYVNDEARKLGSILKQVDQTKHFCFNWR
ncbi:DUF7823 domain-containing protein [Xenorhabdus bovienii]|uniref:DUF7823 domain-containing protein n=1 Tax=Xenorhabdus bovienii TaxID=40576 RepID=UPI003DA2E78F